MRSISHRVLWFSQATDSWVSLSFFKLGGSIYDNPWKFLLLPVLIVLACTPGFTNFRQENNAEQLYTPQNAEAFGDRDVIEGNFGFDPVVDTVYAVSLGSEGAPILTTNNMLAWYDTYQEIVDMVEDRSESDGEWNEDVGTAINLTTVCHKVGDVCMVNSILAFWDYNRSLIAGRSDVQLVADIADAGNTATELSGQPCRLDQVASVNADGVVVAFRINFYLMNNKVAQDDGPDDDARRHEWEYNRYLTTPDSRGSLALYSFNKAAQSEASKSTIKDDITLLTTGYLLLLAYAILVLSRGNSVHTHGTLALASFTAVLLAIVGCFALGSAFGIPFSGVTQTLSFLLLGLGMDDAFVLVAAFQQPDVRTLPPKQRVQKALSRAGTSITVTSVTDIVAFLAGSITDIPAIRDFCYFAAIGIAFDFFLQITFFVVLMVFSAQREEKKRYDWLCCVTAKNPSKNCCSNKTFDENDFEEPMTKFLRDKFAPALLSPVGKASVIAITVGLLGASSYFITQLEVDMNFEWFVPESSPLQDVFDIRQKFFGSVEIPSTIYTMDIDYTTATAQTELQAITTALNSSALYAPDSCRNWWPLFIAFAAGNNAAAVTNNVVAPAQFYTIFDQFYADPSSNGIKDSLLLKTVGGVRTIKGTEIPCRFHGNKEADETQTDFNLRAMDESRRIAKLGGSLGRARAYASYYVWWDGLSVVYDQILFNVMLAVIAVFVICIILLGSVPAACIVFLMLICIDVDVLGSYWYWGEDINYVSGIFLVLAVGLSVDACAHITHTFLDSDGTGNERATRALEVIGRSVLNGGISTMLVLVPLSTAGSYIFQVFFKCFLSILSHSLWHGMFVLPVVLSIAQPQSFSQIREKLGMIEGQMDDKVAPSDEMAFVHSQKKVDTSETGVGPGLTMQVITAI